MLFDGYELWKRVDALRKNISLSQICKETGLNYSRVKENRSDNRLPNLEDAYMFARYLGCSMEYLLSGKDNSASPEADFVMSNESARLLIRRIMDDPRLLDALAAVAALAVTPGESKEKNA